jgi:glutamate---cysteine ligase / carboxylate-amine ligase
VYDDLALLDPEGVLRYEWVNARGAIARFDRGTIEIRVLDTQECPAVDLALLDVVVAVLRALTERDRAWHAAAHAIGEDELAVVLAGTIVAAEQAPVRCPPLAEILGWSGGDEGTAGELWAHLVSQVAAQCPELAASCAVVTRILKEGCLARRIRRAVEAGGGGGAAIGEVYHRLADCLQRGVPFPAA